METSLKRRSYVRQPMNRGEAQTNAVAIDFDGVLHKYSREWDDGTIYDDPVDGAADAMQALLDHGLEVVIYSTRCHDREVNGEFEPHQRAEMADWLEKHKIPYTRIHDQPGKTLCSPIVDDCCHRFEGDWKANLPEVLMR